MLGTFVLVSEIVYEFLDSNGILNWQSAVIDYAPDIAIATGVYVD